MTLAAAPGFFTLAANCSGMGTIAYVLTNTATTPLSASVAVSGSATFPLLLPNATQVFDHPAGAASAEFTIGNPATGDVVTLRGFDVGGAPCETYLQGLSSR